MENEDKINNSTPENNEVTEENAENSAENPIEEEKKAETAENSEAPEKGPDYKALYEEINDKFLRLYSEFENSKKRHAREKVDLVKSASSDVLKAILPVLDDFERAIKANQSAQDIEAIKSGFTLINQKLFNLLETKGLKKMDVIGKPLDTDLHEAITQIPAPTEELKGKIVDVIENGFFINDIVLRHAKVIVGI
ncbi:MAG TPA: nucleotide exchange factor GrpE [Flavobacteriales bacterium]|nr:nucleotide exchange factor GrpE [Flavobacteriales bacterium]